MDGPTLLGIDNVIFDVADLDGAVAFYETCGFQLKFKIDAKGLALFAIGSETPGLLLRERSGGTGRVWVEVENAGAVASHLETFGIPIMMIETATGRTCEVSDPSGNIVGFADYTRQPNKGRVQR